MKSCEIPVLVHLGNTQLTNSSSTSETGTATHPLVPITYTFTTPLPTTHALTPFLLPHTPLSQSPLPYAFPALPWPSIWVTSYFMTGLESSIARREALCCCLRTPQPWQRHAKVKAHVSGGLHVSCNPLPPQSVQCKPFRSPGSLMVPKMQMVFMTLADPLLVATSAGPSDFYHSYPQL